MHSRDFPYVRPFTRKMLGLICKRLAEKRVILASASPRRAQILQNVGFPFEVVPSQFVEDLDKTQFPETWQYALATARGKAIDVAERLKTRQDWAVVIGADTIVVQDDVIIEKPGSAEKATEMINMLQGHTHLVCTGVVLLYRERDGGTKEHCFYEVTEVTMATLTQDVVESYVQSGEPLDKAGGYGIQGLGGTLVKSINGDYFNVVGLPLHRLCTELLSVLK